MMFLFKVASTDQGDDEVYHRKQLVMDDVIRKMKEQGIKTRAKLFASGILKEVAGLGSTVKTSKQVAAEKLKNLKLQIKQPKCYAYKRIYDGVINIFCLDFA
jgi:hypothetical protein